MSSLLKWCRILANNRPGNSQNIHIQQRKQPQGRSAPLWGAAEGRASAFSLKCGGSVAEDVHSADVYRSLDVEILDLGGKMVRQSS